MPYIQKDKVIFPCKLDPLHLGHVVQIKKLLRMYDEVILDVLDYGGRVMSPTQATFTLHEVLTKNEVKRIHLRTHKISYLVSTENLSKEVDIYTGNNALFKKLKEEGFKVYKMERYGNYRSSHLRQYWNKSRNTD